MNLVIINILINVIKGQTYTVAESNIKKGQRTLHAIADHGQIEI